MLLLVIILHLPFVLSCLIDFNEGDVQY